MPTTSLSVAVVSLVSALRSVTTSRSIRILIAWRSLRNLIESNSPSFDVDFGYRANVEVFPWSLRFIIAMAAYAINERMCAGATILRWKHENVGRSMARRPIEDGSPSLMSNGAGWLYKERR